MLGGLVAEVLFAFLSDLKVSTQQFHLCYEGIDDFLRFRGQWTGKRPAQVHGRIGRPRAITFSAQLFVGVVVGGFALAVRRLSMRLIADRVHTLGFVDIHDHRPLERISAVTSLIFYNNTIMVKESLAAGQCRPHRFGLRRIVQNQMVLAGRLDDFLESLDTVRDQKRADGLERLAVAVRVGQYYVPLDVLAEPIKVDKDMIFSTLTSVVVIRPESNFNCQSARWRRPSRPKS